ncbi:DUF1641 domain-containing protein [Halocatena pleomorpha]|uniref:DUF1641 domain-containing protein n=1 Tax=Halocatena pleomorpha TaxID=1785090 RepID=A0A3P3RA62_9EURY|nr:DUF1641 domain-containing protein [Halocatena pleomorpha]RRJ29570.1 DUF1641 domain-containing protein [Halocatena pleomorpha]
MADPTTTVPETAMNRRSDRPQEGTEALRAVLEEYGSDYAAAAEYTDELEDILETAVLVLASADDEEVEYVTDSVVTLIEAADAVSTDGTVALADGVSENASELTELLETVGRLQRQGHVDTFVAITETLSTSLTEEEAEELAVVLGENGSEVTAAIDSMMELQREGHLDDLVELSKTLSALEIDESTVTGLNRVLNAVGEAEHDPEPIGLYGSVRSLTRRDVRTSLGYLMNVLKAQGRRLRKGP